MTRAIRRMRKALVMVACMALVAGLAIGGTIAWLSAKTQTVTNTFSPENIDITLTETMNTDTDDDDVNDAWKMEILPGNSAEKNPTVTVEAGSAACWLFVKIEETDIGTLKFTDYINYSVKADHDVDSDGVADGWMALGDTYPGIYYIEVPAVTADTSFAVLENNTVSVPKTVTKAAMDELQNQLGEGDNLELKFTAYAVQRANINSAVDAWTQASGVNTSYNEDGANTSNTLSTED